MRRSATRRTLLCALVIAGLAIPIGAGAGKPGRRRARSRDAHRPAGREADGGRRAHLGRSSTRAYIARIEALNKRGPGLNAVTQLNPDALKDAALLDKERAHGHLRGPAHGLPVLLKDLIDVKGMYTSNGNYSLRNSFPATDSGIAKKLRESGVVILGKLGLSEFANCFGNQPSGFANLTGQVLNALDADQNPSGSSSGTGAAGAAALSMLTHRHRDLGLDHQPVAGATASSACGRPSASSPAYGIAPDLRLAGHRRPDGPHGRQRGADAAVDRRPRSRDEQLRRPLGPDTWRATVIPPAPDAVPDYLSALDLNFVQRQAHRLQRHARPTGTPARRSPTTRSSPPARSWCRAPHDRPSAPCPRAARRLRGSTDINDYYATSARSRRSSRWTRRSRTTTPSRTRR